jgi:hypothetical protein
MISDEHFALDSMRFTASVMGNPEYLTAVKNIKQAKDERHVGIEKLNSFHAHQHAERQKRAKKEPA